MSVSGEFQRAPSWVQASVYISPPVWIVLLAIAALGAALALLVASSIRAKRPVFRIIGLTIGVLVWGLVVAVVASLGVVDQRPALMARAQQTAADSGFVLLVPSGHTISNDRTAIGTTVGGVTLYYPEGYITLTEWKDTSPVTTDDLYAVVAPSYANTTNFPTSAVTKQTVQGHPALAVTFDFPRSSPDPNQTPPDGQASVLVAQLNGVKIGLLSWGDGYMTAGTAPGNWQPDLAVSTPDLVAMANTLAPAK